MQTDLVISLFPKQSEFDRMVERVPNVLYGGARGGAKSVGIRFIMLKRRIQYPGSIGGIFRKTWEEVRDNHLNPLLEKFPELRSRYVAGEKEIRFENGSRLLFRHAKDFPALKKKQGLEFNDLAIDEIGDWPEEWFEFLKASNRSGKRGVPARCLLAGNPGGLGHKWLKRRFITREFRGKERPEDYAFVPARVYDNPVIMQNNPEYVNNLESMGNEVLRRAWLDGDWDVMAGQFFDGLSRDIHICEPFEIPDYWTRITGFDSGYNHPACFLWGAVDTDGNVFIYREYVVAKRRSEEIAQDVMQFKDYKNLGSIPSGWDCWAKHGGGPSVEEKFSDASGHSLVLHKANIDRVAGAQQVRDYLAVRGNGQPRLKFFKTCPIVFDCITRMTHDPNNPEDVLKVDASDGDPWTGDDPYDGLRHLLMDRPKISVEPAKPQRRRYYGDDDGGPSGNWKTV